MSAGSHTDVASGPASRRARRLVVVAGTLGCLAVLALLLAVRLANPQPYSGDEPHYLLLSNSLFLDGDADVKNDYLLGRYASYFPYPIDRHINGKLFTSSSPHWYSQHGIGLAALLVPAVIFDDARGASVAMVFVAAIVLGLTFLWARRFTGEIWCAAIAAAALGLSPFFLGLEGRIFPDLPAAALLLGCLLLLEMPRRRPGHLFLLGALIGVSPWLHLKNALSFGTICAIAAVQIVSQTRGNRRTQSLLLLGIPILVLFVGYETAVHAWYGSWRPTRMFSPGNELFALSVPRGIAATAFDGGRGMFTNNPALLLILAGLPIWARLWRGPCLRLGLVIGPTILLQVTFNDWSGGYSPAGRYALQFIPALVPAVALLLLKAPAGFRVLGGALLGLQLALVTAYVWLDPFWGFVGLPNPLLTALDQRVGLALYRAMPIFDSDAELMSGVWQLAVWVLVCCLLIGYGVQLSRRTSERCIEVANSVTEETRGGHV